MKAPPDSENLSLAAALEFVKRQVGASSTYSSRVWRPLYRALCEGKLWATGDFINRDDVAIWKDKQVAPDDWRALNESDFSEACYRSRVLILPDSDRLPRGRLFLSNVRIETKQLRSWLGVDATARSISPATTFSRHDLERDVGEYIRAQQAEGSTPRQGQCAERLGKRYPRDAIRDEFKRQAEKLRLPVGPGRPRKNSPA